MPLSEAKVRLERAISRGNEILENSTATDEQYRTWHTSALGLIEKAFPHSGHIYTFIGQSNYSAHLDVIAPYAKPIDRLRLNQEILILKSLLQEIGNELEVQGLLEPVPSTDFWSDIHSDIAKASRSLFETGHYGKSVLSALIELNNQVKRVYRDKTGIERDGSGLMEAAFSANDPKILLGDQSTETGKSTQKGLMQIFAGAMTGIRNPNAHENLQLTENEAKHYLYLASLLMKIFRDAVAGKLHHLPSTQQ